jgi:hypothetical protein
MIGKKIFATLTLVSLVVAPNLHAAKCSNALLKGTYAYSSQGFTEVTPDISPAGFVPFAQTGLIAYDGKGSVVFGTFTDSTTTANGGSFRGTFTGTYVVNGDCSGMMQVDLGDGNLFHFDLVVHGPSRHTAVGTDPGVLMSVFSIEKIAGEKEATATK